MTRIVASAESSLIIDRTTLADRLGYAAAARIVGHVGDRAASGPLAEQLDALVHVLSELRGDPHALAAHKAVVPGATHAGAPTLTASAGGVR